MSAIVKARGAATSIKHRQLPVVILQNNLCCVTVVTGIVLPFTSLKLALNVNLSALFKILLRDLTKLLIENDNAMPLCFLAPLAGLLVPPRIRGRKPQIADGPPILGMANFWVRPEIADKDDFVH